MNIAQIDRCKVPQVFWREIKNLGLQPAVILRQARLPATLAMHKQSFVTTDQLFSIWKAIEELTEDPAFGIKVVEATNAAQHKPAFIAACYAADYRDALSRVARFKRLCSPDDLLFEEQDGQFRMTKDWRFASEPEPALLVDTSFGFLLELGRKGTGQHLTPVRMEFARSGPKVEEHQHYFGCSLRYGASRDMLVLKSSDVDRPFPGHNPEILDILTPALTAALSEIQAQSTIGEQVKAVLKRGMASGRPDIAGVARELGMSERTLQRRITEGGATFRSLLAEARQDLGRHLLSDESIEVDEVAFLLGYQDVSSFYRAFRDWEGMSPNRWRETDSAQSSQQQDLARSAH
jgi:AraC-like DNA-binding protein